MSKPIKNREASAENEGEMGLKDLPPEGEQVGGKNTLPSTIAGGGGQGAMEVNDKAET